MFPNTRFVYIASDSFGPGFHNLFIYYQIVHFTDLCSEIKSTFKPLDNVFFFAN